MSISLSFFIFIILSIAAVQATVPANKTFQYVNEGYYGEYDTEYGATYRLIFEYQNNGFALCFYNTTPGAYTLGLRMGQRPEDTTSNIMRWVWAANRDNLVGENATLTLGANGNLVLAGANGKVAWQTGTANKGVVGFELRANGNLVLVNSQGKFVWQSFDYPTDTLLVGQGLRKGATTSLISRVSAVDGSKGRFSYVLEEDRVSMYLTSKNSAKPLLYYQFGDLISGDPYGYREFTAVVLNSAPVLPDSYEYRLSYNIYVGNDTTPFSYAVARPKYDTILSFLRLESNGNLIAYTYYDKLIVNSWELVYSLFDRDGRFSVSECKLPTRCGALGLCSNSQCVGCPTPKGSLAWSESCAPPKLPACKKGAYTEAKYYKVVGVEHFTNGYTEGEGPLKVSECRTKCNQDCGCLGFFYREESSKCLVVPELGTLMQVSNQTHVAYIKTA